MGLQVDVRLPGLNLQFNAETVAVLPKGKPACQMSVEAFVAFITSAAELAHEIEEEARDQADRGHL